MRQRLTGIEATTMLALAAAVATGAGCASGPEERVVEEQGALSAAHARARARLASPDQAGGPTGNGISLGASLTPHGRLVAYTSEASNLVALADLNGTFDVFVRDIPRATTTLVSVDVTGTAAGNGVSELGGAQHDMSADGRYVVFQSSATNLVDGISDSNGTSDVFVRDLRAGVTELVSVSAAGGATANGDSFRPSISADGRYVAYQSLATDLVAGVTDGNFGTDVFLRDRRTGTTRLLSAAVGGTSAAAQGAFGPLVSRDGGFVVFSSNSPDIVASPPDTNATSDVFLHDVLRGTTRVISVNAEGTATGNGTSEASGDVISDDGNVVGFESLATDLVAGESDTNGEFDVFVFDRARRRTALMSARPGTRIAGNDFSFLGAVSGDGRVVSFSSNATDLVVGRSGPIAYTPGAANVFARDRFARSAEILSVDPTGTVANNRPFSSGGNPSGGSIGSSNSELDGDGDQVIFESDATNLIAGVVDANDAADIFVHERHTGRNRLLSASAAGTATADGFSFTPFLSADGSTASFHSFADDLVGPPGTVPGISNIYTVRFRR